MMTAHPPPDRPLMSEPPNRINTPAEKPTQDDALTQPHNHSPTTQVERRAVSDTADSALPPQDSPHHRVDNIRESTHPGIIMLEKGVAPPSHPSLAIHSIRPVSLLQPYRNCRLSTPPSYPTAHTSIHPSTSAALPSSSKARHPPNQPPLRLQPPKMSSPTSTPARSTSTSTSRRRSPPTSNPRSYGGDFAQTPSRHRVVCRRKPEPGAAAAVSRGGGGGGGCDGSLLLLLGWPVAGSRLMPAGC